MTPEKVDYLLYEPEDTGILWIRFNRPERMNALHLPDSLAKLVEYMRAGDDDPDIRAIVLTGNGRAFCAGADLKENERPQMGPGWPPAGPDMHRQRFTNIYYPYFNAISEIRKPTIAMVNGPAVGMGFDISMRCDLALGCENTRFFTYKNVGQILENGGMYFLPKLVGLRRALEMATAIYTGGFLSGEEAHRWGLLNRYVPADQLEAETRELCQKIIDSPPLPQWAGKRIMRRAIDTNLATVQDLCANASGIFTVSEDAQEARRAFFEKRAAVFTGR